MTAHTIDTRVGKLELEHGFPANSQTVAKLYDEMDFQRATQAYLWAVPAVSFQSFQTGFFRSGVDYNDVVIFDNFLDTKTLALTATTRPSTPCPSLIWPKMDRSSLKCRPVPRPAWSTIIGSAPRP